jgi:pullulanase
VSVDGISALVLVKGDDSIVAAGNSDESTVTGDDGNDKEEGTTSGEAGSSSQSDAGTKGAGGLSGGAVAGIIAGAAALVGLVAYLFGKKKK